MLNQAHLHLLINHFPVVGSFLGLALLAYALVRGTEEITKTALGGYVLLAAAGVVVYLTGEGAEEVVEDLPGITHSLIERHEEMALIATVALGLFGILALLAIYSFRNRPLPQWLPTAALVLAMVPATLMGVTAYFGGQIRHDEIRGDSAAAESSPVPPAESVTPAGP